MQHAIAQLSTMKAVVMRGPGGPQVLSYEDMLVPEPGLGEVLVRVRAATVNHTDIFHRTGQFSIQKEMPHVLGMDVAGEIVRLGEGVEGWDVGDHVVATFEALGRERNGAYAEYTTLPANQLYRIPDGLDFIPAASIGLAFTTAWIAMFYNGHVGAGDCVVVHAASSGVGTSALQIARWKGATVIAISEANKAERLHRLGAHVVLDRTAPPESIIQNVMQATEGGRGASLVLDLVGRASLQQSISMLRRRGRIVCAGTLSGDVAQINVMDLIMKNGSITGSFDLIRREDMEKILSLFADETFIPVIDSVMPLSLARSAHERIESGAAFGKIVLVPET